MKKYYWLFYNVKEDYDSITIIFRTSITYFNSILAIIGFIGCFTNNSSLSITMFIMLFISMIFKNIVYSKIKKQVLKWEKRTRVKTIGSKFSYSDPLRLIAYKLK